MKDAKFKIVFEVLNKEGYEPVGFHYTSLERLISGKDLFPYDSVRVIAKRQSIGMSDLSGKLIYEGDIILWGHIKGFSETTPRKAVVVLNPDIGFSTFNLGENNHVFEFGNFAYAGSISKAVEVIGNIDQDLELVNEYK